MENKISIRKSINSKSGLTNFCEYVKKNLGENITLLEIGSYVGDSSVIFATYFKRVICVDPWINGYDQTDPASYSYDMKIIESEFDLNIKSFKNITKIKKKSDEYAPMIKNESIDIVYIDGLHTYEGCKKDIIDYLPKVKIGGFISGHDFDIVKFPGVVKAVNEKLGTPNETFSDTSWIFKKIK